MLNPFAARILWLYLLIVGSGLFVQGVGSLLLRAGGHPDPAWGHGFVNADPRHAPIHIVWGLVILSMLARRSTAWQLARLAVTFGLFYVALAILGVLVYHPFGLMLDRGENAFHFTVGPSCLALGLWALWASAPRRADVSVSA
jgi:hypothetical protein